MHLIYVDESGDPGAKLGASKHFILCGLLVHHADWHAVNRRMAEMRARLFATHGLPMMAELHASEFLSDSSNHLGLSQRARLQCLLHVLGCIQRQGDLTPICVIVEKGGTNPLAPAWIELTRLAQVWIDRATPHPSCVSAGLAIVCDDIRPSPGRPWVESVLHAQPLLGELLVDLPFGRESQDSHLLQACDLLSFLTKQSLAPNRFFSSRGGKQLLKRLQGLWNQRGLRVWIKG
jgi:hypothetical protein